jgi:hypothetical protein
MKVKKWTILSFGYIGNKADLIDGILFWFFFLMSSIFLIFKIVSQVNSTLTHTINDWDYRCSHSREIFYSLGLRVISC